MHELFLEERVENGHPDPARLVKLKRRQLNGSAFDLKPGKSYMEKFLESASPEHKVVCEVSATPSPLKLTLENSSESGLEILEISTVSPVKKSSEVKESTCLSPNKQELVLRPFTDELNDEAIDRGILKVPDPSADGETDESPSTVHKMAIEEELAVDAVSKTEGSLDGDHSDDITSEVDNYMDALATMDSEMETDNECKPKSNHVILNVDKHVVDSETNQANFSDSQSIGNSSVSDGGNSSFKKGRSSFSYSDSLSNLADNSPSDGEGAAKMFPSSENCAAEIVDLPSYHPCVYVVGALGTESHEPIVFTDVCTEEEKIPDPGEVPCGSGLTDLNPTLLPSIPAANSLVASLEGPELDETSYDCTKLGSKSPSTYKSGTNLADSSVVLCDICSQTRHDNFITASDESHPVDELDHAVPTVFSDAFVDTSNLLELAREKKSGEDSVNEMLQIDYADEICAENLVEGKIASPHSTSSSTKEQLLCSALPEVEVDSSVTLLPDSLDVLKPGDLASEVDDAIAAMGVNSEKLTPAVDTSEYKCLDIKADASHVEIDSTKVGMKIEEIAVAEDVGEMGGLTSKVDLVEGDCVPLKHPSNCSDKPDPEDHMKLDNIASETVQAEDVAASAIATGGADDEVVNNATCPSSDLICSPSRNLTDIQESCSGSEDLHQKGLEFNELTSPDCLTESMAKIEIKQLEVASRDLDVDPYKSDSGDHTSLEVIEHLNDSSLAEQTQSRLYVSDDTITPSSEPSNLELESKPTYQSHSVDNSEDYVHSPTCYLPEAVTYSKQSMGLQHDQISAEFVCSNDANSESLNLQASCTFYHAEPGIPSEQSLELQSDKLDEGCERADEANSRSSNLLSEQIPTLGGHIDQERYFDASSKEDLPSQELRLQSAGRGPKSTELAMNPFDSIFPSFGLLPGVNHVNLEAMPPLPPLPPMQWRIGRVQHAPLASQEDLIEHSRDTFLPIQLSITDEKAQYDFPSSCGEVMQPSSPPLSLTVADSQISQHSSAESVGNSLQPTPLPSEMSTIDNEATSQQNYLPLEQTQSLESCLTLPKVPNESLAHGFPASGGESMQASSNPFSPVPTVEHTISGHDPVPSQGLPVQLLNQLAPETGLEGKVLDHGLQNLEGEHGNSPKKSVVPLTTEEEQPQLDSVTSQGETTWSPSTLALPPTYQVGKPNGNKLPRPRNPLIDAVAAHDKSKVMVICGIFLTISLFSCLIACKVLAS